VANAIAKTGTNIKQGQMGSEDHQAQGDFLVEVKNLSQLERIRRAILGVKGVARVDRKQFVPQTPKEEKEGEG
jgi:(p)ppGpp synthase/HD superfamily hydrolase